MLKTIRLFVVLASGIDNKKIIGGSAKGRAIDSINRLNALREKLIKFKS